MSLLKVLAGVAGAAVVGGMIYALTRRTDEPEYDTVNTYLRTSDAGVPAPLVRHYVNGAAVEDAHPAIGIFADLNAKFHGDAALTTGIILDGCSTAWSATSKKGDPYILVTRDGTEFDMFVLVTEEGSAYESIKAAMSAPVTMRELLLRTSETLSQEEVDVIAKTGASVYRT